MKIAKKTPDWNPMKIKPKYPQIDLFSHPNHSLRSHCDKKACVTLGWMSQSELTMMQGSNSTTISQLRPPTDDGVVMVLKGTCFLAKCI